MGVWDEMAKRDLACSPDLGLMGCPWDLKEQQEGPSMYFQTWDCRDVSWDPKTPWDNGTPQSPSGHSMAKLDY